jgi:hypothetical protein
VNIPSAVTSIVCVVAPFDHKYESAVLEVKEIVSPSHAEVAVELIVGTGELLTLTFTAFEVDEQPSVLVTVTVYEPDIVTVISCVFNVFDHRFPVVELELRVTEPPVQKDVGPLASIVGVAGNAFTTTVINVLGLSSPAELF